MDADNANGFVTIGGKNKSRKYCITDAPRLQLTTFIQNINTRAFDTEQNQKWKIRIPPITIQARLTVTQKVKNLFC